MWRSTSFSLGKSHMNSAPQSLWYWPGGPSHPGKSHMNSTPHLIRFRKITHELCTSIIVILTWRSTSFSLWKSNMNTWTQSLWYWPRVPPHSVYGNHTWTPHLIHCRWQMTHELWPVIIMILTWRSTSSSLGKSHMDSGTSLMLFSLRSSVSRLTRVPSRFSGSVAILLPENMKPITYCTKDIVHIVQILPWRYQPEKALILLKNTSMLCVDPTRKP